MSSAGSSQRRRWSVTLLTVVLVFGVLGVVADRVAAGAADRRIGEHVDAELAGQGVRTERTDVQVGGFPFLTQVLSGDYEQINIDMIEVRAEGARLPRLLVRATGVHAGLAEVLGGNAQITAEEVTGTGTIDWATLASLVDTFADLPASDLSFAPVGAGIRTSGTMRIAGEPVPVSATVSVRLDGASLRLSLTDGSVAGREVPSAVRDTVSRQLGDVAVTVPIPPLPFQLSVDAIAVTPDGLQVTATARNVTLAGTGAN